VSALEEDKVRSEKAVIPANASRRAGVRLLLHDYQIKSPTPGTSESGFQQVSTAEMTRFCLADRLIGYRSGMQSGFQANFEGWIAQDLPKLIHQTEPSHNRREQGHV